MSIQPPWESVQGQRQTKTKTPQVVALGASQEEVVVLALAGLRCATEKKDLVEEAWVSSPAAASWTKVEDSAEELAEYGIEGVAGSGKDLTDQAPSGN
jgi:hypothetical protein